MIYETILAAVAAQLKACEAASEHSGRFGWSARWRKRENDASQKPIRGVIVIRALLNDLAVEQVVSECELERVLRRSHPDAIPGWLLTDESAGLVGAVMGMLEAKMLAEIEAD